MTTGTVAGDSCDLLEPLRVCLDRAREAMRRELNTDPAPDFTCEQIKETTQWLHSIAQAMVEHNSGFTKLGLSRLDDEALERHQELARESSRQLTLLFAEKSGEFSDSSLNCQIAEFGKGSQSHEVRKNLKEFTAFLRHFGHSKWLGDLVAPEFTQQKEDAVRLLQALQRPTKRSLPGHGKVDFLGDLLLKSDQSSSAQLRQLAIMATDLSVICWNDAAARAQAEKDMERKMQLLKQFAEAMNDVPGTLRHFLLLRSGSIKDDLKDLKSWVSQEEADKVHMQLDRFRDEVTEEKVMRRVKQRIA